MIDRRRVVRAGLATLGSLPLATPLRALAQKKPAVKVRYNEVVRSIMYTPAYVAIAKGYFGEVGIEQTLATANGGDKSMAALLANAADIALMGPEAPIYVMTSDSPTKPRIFCGLTSTDGFMLLGREKVAKFDWNMLRGKEILGFRPGSTPILFLEAALRKNGIDPQKDVKLMNNVAPAARVGSWLAGQNQYGIFVEPDASQLEIDGKAHFLASVGETVGFADYTAFTATEKYIKENPEVIQNWTNAIHKAQGWTAQASSADIGKVLEPFFPGVNPQALVAAAERYQRLKIWKTTPIIDPKAIDKFEDILVEGHVLDPDKRVKYQDLVLTEFAEKAK
jgi:NitT/TauT family transport system substrate-binding protein